MIYKILIKIIIFPIKLYQLCLSPYLPKTCRYYPTCSEYAIIAINKYGIIRGLFISIKRILRCQPFAGSGNDPVP
ncbi:MAG TPA: membrane protein insertion efficiency factor YidD [Burkholderiales bacterium]|nr:membrane protein insertion efficiency factor YidD [Burkholderiales bacterium]